MEKFKTRLVWALILSLAAPVALLYQPKTAKAESAFGLPIISQEGVNGDFKIKLTSSNNAATLIRIGGQKHQLPSDNYQFVSSDNPKLTDRNVIGYYIGVNGQPANIATVNGKMVIGSKNHFDDTPYDKVSYVFNVDFVANLKTVPSTKYDFQVYVLAMEKSTGKLGLIGPKILSQASQSGGIYLSTPKLITGPDDAGKTTMKFTVTLRGEAAANKDLRYCYITIHQRRDSLAQSNSTASQFLYQDGDDLGTQDVDNCTGNLTSSVSASSISKDMTFTLSKENNGANYFVAFAKYSRAGASVLTQKTYKSNVQPVIYTVDPETGKPKVEFPGSAPAAGATPDDDPGSSSSPSDCGLNFGTDDSTWFLKAPLCWVAETVLNVSAGLLKYAIRDMFVRVLEINYKPQ